MTETELPDIEKQRLRLWILGHEIGVLVAHTAQNEIRSILAATYRNHIADIRGGMKR